MFLLQHRFSNLTPRFDFACGDEKFPSLDEQMAAICPEAASPRLLSLTE